MIEVFPLEFKILLVVVFGLVLVLDDQVDRQTELDDFSDKESDSL